MFKRLACVNGHRWELDLDSQDADLLGKVCPCCGNAAETLPPDAAGTASPADRSAGSRPLPRLPGYEVLDLLGEGGMGTVYRARQTDLGRLVALKQMKPAGPSASVEEIQRFRLEAEAMARLEHPGIVKIYEVKEHEGRPFFAMELVEGGSLDARLRRGPLPPAEAAALCERLAQAVQHAHDRGIIHRDLKPANVLLAEEPATKHTKHTKDDKDNEEGKEERQETGAASASSSLRVFRVFGESSLLPKITDFGLARRLEGAGPSRTGEVLGTPQYMAPEQVPSGSSGAAGEPVGPAADVYALGVVLYECLTGRPPFAAPTLPELLLLVLFADPLPVRRLQPKVPRDLQTICERCLRKEPSKRYGSAAELAEDLRRFRAGEPIRARPVGRLERGVKWARRKPASAALAASLVLLAALAVGGGLWRWVDGQAQLARTRREVEPALREAAQRYGLAQAARNDPAKWEAALAAARRARAALDSGQGDQELNRRVDEMLAQIEAGLETAQRAADREAEDRNLVKELANIRAQGMVPLPGGGWPHRRRDEAYAAALAKRGFVVGHGTPAEAAARVKRQPAGFRDELIAALVDWQATKMELRDKEGFLWLYEVLHEVQPDEWRRKGWLEWSGAAHRHLLEQAIQRGRKRPLPPATACLLARAMPQSLSELSVELLTEAWRHFPDDFEINLQLGVRCQTCKPPRYDEAIRYLSVAAAIRKDNVHAHHLLGIALAGAGRVDEAIVTYRRALECDSRYSDAHRGLGNALVKQKREEEAITCYHRAIECDPNNALAYCNLGQLLKDQGRDQEAIPWFLRALERAPDLAVAHNGLGTALGSLGRKDDAVLCFRRAIQHDASLAVAHYNLGVCLTEQKCFDEAMLHLHRAIKEDPRSGLPYVTLGAILHDEHGQVDEALACFRKAVEREPASAQAHFNLGVALWSKGKRDEALTAYLRALSFDPRLTTAYPRVGELLLAAGKRDEAAAWFRQGLLLDEKNVGSCINLGERLRARGKLEEALVPLREVVAADPSNALAHTNLGLVHKEMRKPAQAIASYQQAMRHCSQFASDAARADLCSKLGVALMESGELDEAARYYSRALEYDPRHARAHYNRGVLCHLRKDLDGAIAATRKALECDERYAAAHNNLGWFLGLKGKATEACACFRKAIAYDANPVQPYHNLLGALNRQGEFIEALAVARQAVKHFSQQKGHPAVNDMAEWVSYFAPLARMQAHLPDFQRGKFWPETDTERIALIRVCLSRQLHLAVVRLSDEEIESRKKAADDPSDGMRYQAARCAVLAAGGRSGDAGGLDAEQRSRWRARALAWLRSDLAVWSQRHGSKDAQQRALARKTLRGWRRDGDLASVREPKALEELKPEEREAWKKLWADVDALLRKD